MSIIELGSLAGATVAVITLISKIISLITSIQNLIHRLDRMQTEIESNQVALHDFTLQMKNHDQRLTSLEVDTTFVKDQLKEAMTYAY
ncbi:hypothetical protein ACF3NG_01585 [Aerococcaceae bacterium WGS1372]